MKCSLWLNHRHPGEFLPKPKEKKRRLLKMFRVCLRALQGTFYRLCWGVGRKTRGRKVSDAALAFRHEGWK